jgi:autotransporter family porin
MGQGLCRCDFNPSASTSVFTKVDVTFGEDIDGIGGKAGMRIAW